MSRWTPEDWKDPPQAVRCDICCTKAQSVEKLYRMRLGLDSVRVCLSCFIKGDLKPKDCD